jgi:hypothetical protein
MFLQLILKHKIMSKIHSKKENHLPHEFEALFIILLVLVCVTVRTRTTDELGLLWRRQVIRRINYNKENKYRII